MAQLLADSDTLVVEAALEHTATVLFLHGLGDQPESIRDTISQYLRAEELGHIKWILPRSPNNPVQANGGKPMASWHDIKVFGFQSGVEEDEQGMMTTVQRIHTLLEEEISAGMPARRILLVGFSQGGAMSMLAAIMSKREIGGAASMSGWMPLRHKVKTIATEYIGRMPIFWSHGTTDRNIPKELKEESVQALRELNGENVEEHMYEKDHQMCVEEAEDLKQWMGGVIPQ